MSKCRLCGIYPCCIGHEIACYKIYKRNDPGYAKRFKNMFETKDSGKRQVFETGMQRDVQTDKPRYDLIDRVFLKRWAELMARGAQKYGEENWRKAETQEELNRFKASAIRHMYQWLDGDESEDHAAAIAFNLSGAEMVKSKLNANVD